MATSQVQTVVSPLDKVKLAGAVLLVVGALVAFYLLAKQGPLAQWGALIIGLAAAVAVFFVSEPGRELFAFGRDATREVRKVVWPSRKEAIQMTAYVFGFVAVMAIFLWLTDKTLEWLLYSVVLGWR
ncbi:MAG: preprotein translocase subunit SecE [Burkholderiaceae bacterium]|nr:preprotein translocase subunit SecE [Rhodoferax sp.]MCP5263094.1 preprotein translocase subunit SecE [Rhodoferax sp.]MCW5640600.1 preprotein translocase subunit SecE [Rhodoferax sp.]MCZ4316846.1 preprotein translocase subunit SecE [Comamonadaceae bacterium G21597-S1]